MMKNLKKVLALVLVFAMSLSVVAFAGSVYPDVDDTATYAEAVTILKSLGIMKGDDQGNFNPDKTVTRGEMATILCNLAGVGEQAPVDTGFADTTKAHWASGYVAYAKNAGWINGYDANSFGPDDVVKYEQAIKLVMAVANWGIYADENGGYPAGWLMAAAEAEVTKAGAAGSVGEDCTRAKIAMILYYALDANIMKQTAFGDKKWEIQEGETILSKNLDTFKVEGKVSNSYKLNDEYDEGHIDFLITKTNDIDVEDKLGAESVTDEGKVVGYNLIDIDATGTDAADLLAYSSVAYIHVDEYGDATVVAIAAKGNRNKTYEITDMELVYDATKDANERDSRKPNFDSEAGDFKFSYWKDRDADSYISYVKIDPAVIVVRNSEKVDGLITSLGDTTEDILDELVPASGTIKMVDTDNDGYIDLFEAKSYVVAVVDSVNVDRERIMFKERTRGISGYITLDDEINTDLKDVSITMDGKEIALADLAENDVLTISTNDYENPRYFEIIVTRKTVEGKISSMSDSKEVVYIGSEEFEFVGNGLSVDYDAVNMNDEGVFYLAANGKIAYFDDQTVASTNYAVVDKFVADSMGTVSMKILTLEGTKLTANVADKVKLNGVKVNLEDAVTEAALTKMELDIEGTYATYYDLIKAIVDGNEDIIGEDIPELNKLITYDVANDEIDEITFAIQSRDAKEFGYVGSTDGVEVEWQAKNYRFQGSKTLSDKTVVFNLDGNIDDWKVAKAENLVDENLYAPYCFANQDDGTAGVVVIFSSASTINQDDSLAFFVDYRTGVYEVNGDEEDVVYVNYYVDGALAAEALPVYEGVLPEDEDGNIEVLAGDAFLYAKDDKGIVEKFVFVFGAEDALWGDLGEGDLDDFMYYDAADKLDNEVYFGILLKAAGGKLQVVAVPEEGATSISQDTFENVTVADTAKVLQFNAYASTDAKKFVTCESIVDLEVSTYTKVSGSSDINLDIDNAWDDLTYVFFRMNNGVVTEVVGIDYVK